MNNVVPEKQVLDKRLEKFIANVKEICRSSKVFKQKMDVQIGHIAWRATETKSDIRNAMTFERIASVILNGTLHEKRCVLTNPMELAIEGRFLELNYVEYDPIREMREKNVGIRVVVREGSPKHIIVTVYHLKDQDSYVLTLPEVPHEIW